MLSCFICVWLFATPWTVAHQAPLSMGFSRQEYWSGLPYPSPGDLPDPGIKSKSLMPPALAAGSLPLSHLGIPKEWPYPAVTWIWRWGWRRWSSTSQAREASWKKWLLKPGFINGGYLMDSKFIYVLPSEPWAVLCGGFVFNMFLLLSILLCLEIINSTETYPGGIVQSSGSTQFFSFCGRRSLDAKFWFLLDVPTLGNCWRGWLQKESVRNKALISISVL